MTTSPTITPSIAQHLVNEAMTSHDQPKIYYTGENGKVHLTIGPNTWQVEGY